MSEFAPPARADLQEVMKEAFRVRPLLWGFVGVLLLGVSCLVIYASAVGGADALGVGLVVAAAALMAGAFFGFLFAIPRNPTQPAGTSATDRFRSNSNLEEISDWLTKILVGLGLVQFGRLLDGGRTLVDSIASGIGESDPGSETFAGAVLVIFSVTGFLMGYVVTRAIVGPIFAQSEQAMRDYMKEVKEKVDEKVESVVAEQVEKVGSKVDQKVEERVDQKVGSVVNQKVEEKVETAVNQKVEEQVGGRLESLEKKVESLGA